MEQLGEGFPWWFTAQQADDVFELAPRDLQRSMDEAPFLRKAEKKTDEGLQ